MTISKYDGLEINDIFAAKNYIVRINILKRTEIIIKQMKHYPFLKM